MSENEAIHALEVLNKILQDNKNSKNYELIELLQFNMVYVMRMYLFNDK